jgi:hypothetical protein
LAGALCSEQELRIPEREPLSLEMMGELSEEKSNDTKKTEDH